ncbi:transcriptional regulator, HxlR family [Desulfovibrio sp. X2]|uniref:winged helix-turn-helix transcriptional regulator n=1 Tax=Desulfovibrio sp. X2 TaxID=941449 RepID=UPI00035894C9|nr:helix-turn-helix domain-containing protein [Desulfovibrio sp. X2]EPR44485.1 transcriptional regulator, HxlR family [Desulfovibrio sp. X2]
MLRVCAMKRLAGKEYHCFYELALDLVGGKWKPIILYHLALCGRLRFGELRRTISAVSERMLARQLKELEADGLILREAHAEVPPRVDYTLTPIGRKIIPALLALRRFGMDYEDFLGGRDLFASDEYESREDPVVVDGVVEMPKDRGACCGADRGTGGEAD